MFVVMALPAGGEWGCGAIRTGGARLNAARLSPSELLQLTDGTARVLSVRTPSPREI